ncbi:MAG: hypothetical protein ACHP7O_11835, partial [Burkholderiales bacterium]
CDGFFFGLKGFLYRDQQSGFRRFFYVRHGNSFHVDRVKITNKFMAAVIGLFLLYWTVQFILNSTHYSCQEQMYRTVQYNINETDENQRYRAKSMLGTAFLFRKGSLVLVSNHKWLANVFYRAKQPN